MPSTRARQRIITEHSGLSVQSVEQITKGCITKMDKTYEVQATITLAIEAKSEEEAKEMAGHELGALTSFVTCKVESATKSEYMGAWD
jgi:hypothetical protein